MGCVFKNPHIVKNILHPLMEEAIDYKDLKSVYKEYSKGKISRKEFLLVVPEKIEERCLDLIEPEEDLFEVLDYLKSKGYLLGVLSNIPDHIGSYVIKKYKLEKYFDPIVFSGTYGKRKPGLDLYEIFLKESGMDPKNCFFIDDKLVNLETAKKLKIKTIWKKIRRDKLISKIKFKPDYTIKELIELKEIF